MVCLLVCLFAWLGGPPCLVLNGSFGTRGPLEFGLLWALVFLHMCRAWLDLVPWVHQCLGSTRQACPHQMPSDLAKLLPGVNVGGLAGFSWPVALWIAGPSGSSLGSCVLSGVFRALSFSVCHGHQKVWHIRVHQEFLAGLHCPSSTNWVLDFNRSLRDCMKFVL